MCDCAAARWGILSTARVNRHVIAALRVTTKGKLIAVASRTLENASTYAAENDIPLAFGSYDELLSCKDVDCVYISLPNNLHYEWVIRALHAGKHVLCEKPMTLVPQQVAEMYALAKDRNLGLSEGFMYFHTDLFKSVAKVVADGTIGSVRSISGEFGFSWGRGGFRLTSNLEGGGSLWDVGGYLVSYAIALLPEDEVVDATADMLCDATLSSDVSSFFTLRFRSGCVAQFQSSFEGPLRMGIRIVGTQGSLNVANPLKPLPGQPSMIDICHVDGTTKQIEVIDSQSHLYQGEVDDLSEVALGMKPTSDFPASVSLKTVALITQMQTSAKRFTS